jgi:hypothetical protein
MTQHIAKKTPLVPYPDCFTSNYPEILLRVAKLAEAIYDDTFVEANNQPRPPAGHLWLPDHFYTDLIQFAKHDDDTDDTSSQYVMIQADDDHWIHTWFKGLKPELGFMAHAHHNSESLETFREENLYGWVAGVEKTICELFEDEGDTVHWIYLTMPLDEGVELFTGEC